MLMGRYTYDPLSRLATVNTVIRDGAPVGSNPMLLGNQPETNPNRQATTTIFSVEWSLQKSPTRLLRNSPFAIWTVSA